MRDMIITSLVCTMSAPTNSLAAGYLHSTRRTNAKMVRGGSVDTCTSYEVLYPGQVMPSAKSFLTKPPMIINADTDSMNVEKLKSDINSVPIPGSRVQNRDYCGSPEVVLSLPNDRGRRASCNDVSNKPPVSPSSRSGMRSPNSDPGRKQQLGRQEEVPSSFSSCPDLTRDAEQRRRQRLRKNNSTDGRLQRPQQTPEPSPPSSARSSPKLLTVPDVFTTSYTHSFSSPGSSRSPSPQPHIDDLPIPKAAKILGIGYRNSEPDLATGANYIVREGTLVRQSSQKSTSDVPALRRESIPEALEGMIPDIWKVAKYVYVGNVEAMYSQPVLCKWRIQNTVDLNVSDIQDMPEDLLRERCECDSQQLHKPAVLRVELDETKHREAKVGFLEINKFIKCARGQHRNTLICCEDGRSLSVAVAMQYFMHEHDYDFRKAHSRMLKVNPDIELTSAQRNLLHSLHAEDLDSAPTSQGVSKTQEMRRASETSSLPSGPKQAWSDF